MFGKNPGYPEHKKVRPDLSMGATPHSGRIYPTTGVETRSIQPGVIPSDVLPEDGHRGHGALSTVNAHPSMEDVDAGG
jgi:hypothetical protein